MLWNTLSLESLELRTHKVVSGEAGLREAQGRDIIFFESPCVVGAKFFELELLSCRDDVVQSHFLCFCCYSGK